jgi:hypothetical protein
MTIMSIRWCSTPKSKRRASPLSCAGECPRARQPHAVRRGGRDGSALELNEPVWPVTVLVPLSSTPAAEIVPPWLTLFILHETAAHVRYAPSGPVAGREDRWDAVRDGHWGGTITGDWITTDYRRCACGRPGLIADNSIHRAKDVNGIEDDKISCAGAIEAYVRGAITTAVDRS